MPPTAVTRGSEAGQPTDGNGRLTNFDPHLPRIHGNRGKLQQVVLNLILNAKDAMFGSSNPMLRIATFTGAGRALVRIQDSGAGIAREHLHRIYDPFFTTKTQPQEGGHKGTGLGLAVSYGIIQEHAGKIHVESEVSVGTAFQLEFPASGARPTAPPPSRTSGKEETEKTIHV